MCSKNTFFIYLIDVSTRILVTSTVCCYEKGEMMLGLQHWENLAFI